MNDESNDTPRMVPVPRPGFPVALSAQSKAGIRAILSDPANTQPEVSPEMTSASGDAEVEKFGKPLDEDTPIDRRDPKTIDRGPTGDGVRYSMEPWDTPDARAQIEKRCGKLDYSELATTGRIKQFVPISPGALEVTFCTMSPSESIFVQRRAKAESYADFYAVKVEDLALALRDGRGFLITGKDDGSVLTLPDPNMFDGAKFVWQPEVFEANLNRVQYGLPQPVVARLLVNLWWFESRVRTAMLPENLGNFSGPT